jgi:hypothetical protein
MPLGSVFCARKDFNLRFDEKITHFFTFSLQEQCGSAVHDVLFDRSTLFLP